jgi:hypothetical protein
MGLRGGADTYSTFKAAETVFSTIYARSGFSSKASAGLQDRRCSEVTVHPARKPGRREQRRHSEGSVAAEGEVVMR